MCFEILGFDIIIDEKGEPLLLEVNHAPSFNVDTALDADVKKNLLIDTFKILNCTLKEKAHINQVLKDIHEQRMIGITKSNTKDLQMMKHELQLAKLEDTDAYMLSNLGNFERLFPPMTLYAKTSVVDAAKKQAKKTPITEEVKEERNHNTLIEGCVQDDKLYEYYCKFLGNEATIWMPRALKQRL